MFGFCAVTFGLSSQRGGRESQLSRECRGARRTQEGGLSAAKTTACPKGRNKTTDMLLTKVKAL